MEKLKLEFAYLSFNLYHTMFSFLKKKFFLFWKFITFFSEVKENHTVDAEVLKTQIVSNSVSNVTRVTGIMFPKLVVKIKHNAQKEMCFHSCNGFSISPRASVFTCQNAI